MEYQCFVNPTEQLAHLIVCGKCTIGEFERTLAEITQRDDFRPELDQLTDLTRCQLQFKPCDMEDFCAAYSETYRGPGRTAVLSVKPHETALALVHASRVADSREVRVFWTREAAMRWLGRAEDRWEVR